MRNWIISLAGMGLLTGVWMVAQPPPPVPFGEMQFPQFSTPPTCDAGRLSHIYYDTDDSTPYYCDGSNWVAFTLAISGTNPYLARFNSAGTNVETSDVRNSGAPAANSSGSVVDITKTLNNVDGTDTVNMLFIDPTLGTVTGSGNGLRGIHVDSITDPTGMTSGAISISTGWDVGVVVDAPNSGDVAFQAEGGDGLAFRTMDGFFQLRSSRVPAASSGAGMVTGWNAAVMDGNDIVRAILVTFDNADHTGNANTLYAVEADLDANDADTTETAFYADANWDAFLETEAKSTSWNSDTDPTANHVVFYVDESVDRGSGAATADCALIARISTGAEIVISVLVSDGGC